jgi:hypothetical protein
MCQTLCDKITEEISFIPLSCFITAEGKQVKSLKHA